MPGARGPVPVVNRDLPAEILALLAEKETITTDDAFPEASNVEVKSAIDRLKSRDMIEYETKDTEIVLLTAESEKICEEGSHEYKVWDAVRKKGKIAIKDLPKEVGPDSAKIGSGNAFKNKWIKKDGEFLVLVEKEVEDAPRLFLQEVRRTKSTPNAKILAELKKRKLVTTSKQYSYVIRKGPKYAKEMKIEATDLTVEHLTNNAWETEEFKPYNFKALGVVDNSGALHPLNKVRE
jgi:phenylalanyl-tRNA synthetase alpha chain